MKLAVAKFSVLAVCLTVGMTFIPQRVHALSLLMTSNEFWFDRSDRTLVAAELELRGITASDLGAYIKSNSHSVGLDSKKIKLSSFKAEMGIDAVRVSLKSVSHRDLVAIKTLIETLSTKGVQSVRPELPMVPRILNIEKTPSLLKFASSVSGVSLSDLKKIIAKERQNIPVGKPVIFNYTIDNIAAMMGEEWANDVLQKQGDAVVGHLPAGLIGRMPVMIDGESGMFHLRDYHADSIVARYNPGLINRYINEFLQRNKYVEFLALNKYAPGAMPDTRLLEDFIPPHSAAVDTRHVTGADAERLKEKLDRLFSNGWVLKGTNESATALFIITEKTDLVKAIADYAASDFDEYEKQVRVKYAGADEDTIFEQLQKHKDGYFGWKIANYIAEPHRAVVQSKIEIKNEYRSDIFMGEVMPNFTSDRHMHERLARGDKVVPSTPAQFASAEKWVENVIEKLSENGGREIFRNMNGGWDYAKTKSGGYGLIESNIGNESASFYLTGDLVKHVNEFLSNYRSGLNSGKIVEGLPSTSQMKFIRDFSKEFGINLKRMYPGYRFYSDHIRLAYKPLDVPEKFKAAPASAGSSQQLNAEQSNTHRTRSGASAKSCPALFGM